MLFIPPTFTVPMRKFEIIIDYCLSFLRLKFFTTRFFNLFCDFSAIFLLHSSSQPWFTNYKFRPEAFLYDLWVVRGQYVKFSRQCTLSLAFKEFKLCWIYFLVCQKRYNFISADILLATAKKESFSSLALTFNVDKTINLHIFFSPTIIILCVMS